MLSEVQVAAWQRLARPIKCYRRYEIDHWGSVSGRREHKASSTASRLLTTLLYAEVGELIHYGGLLRSSLRPVTVAYRVQILTKRPDCRRRESAKFASGRFVALCRTGVPGHELPVDVPADQPLERPLQSETCPTSYACNSATVVIGVQMRLRPQCAG